MRLPAGGLPAPPFAVFGIAAFASAYAWLVFVTTPVFPGAIGIDYNAVGTDFMVFHAAARKALDGTLAGLFDGAGFTAFLNDSYAGWLTHPLPYRPWVYPPSYLLLMLPFGALGFLPAYAAFQAATAGLLAAALSIGARDRGRTQVMIACALLCPAAAVNLASGQNAFLIAALLVGGVALLDRRPWLAGLVLGVATVKPQFAVLLPVALIAAGQGRALAGMCASAALLVAASALTFGVWSWTAWLDQTWTSLVSPDPKWISYGRIWGNSVWTCAVLMGAPPKLASALQLGAVLLGLVAVWTAFRQPAWRARRLAVLLAATIFVAPHWSPYDAVLLVLAGLLWLQERTEAEAAPWSWALVLLLWLVPVLSPPALVLPGRLAPLLLAGFIGDAILPAWRRKAA